MSGFSLIQPARLLLFCTITVPSDNNIIVPGEAGARLVSFVQLEVTLRTGNTTRSRDKTSQQNLNSLLDLFLFDTPPPSQDFHSVLWEGPCPPRSRVCFLPATSH